jgi:hypothetical protein
VHDPYPPPWAVLDAQEVVRQAVGPAGGMLRRRRPTSGPPVVRIEDRFLAGTLDLRALHFPYLLEFVRCRFEHPPDIRQARLAGLEFTGCYLPGLLARNVDSDNDISLLNTTVFGASVDVSDGRIRGSLNLSGSRLNNRGGRALHADRLELAGALLANNLDVVGEVRVPGLRSGGNVNFSGAYLRNTTGSALDGNGIRVGGNLLCGTDAVTNRRFCATGWVFLPSARIEADLSMRAAQLRPGGADAVPPLVDDPYFDPLVTLYADRIHIAGNADLDKDFTSTGSVRMGGARIGGSLRLTGASVDISAGRQAPFEKAALHLDGATISGSLDARGVRVTGEWRLLDVSVAGSVRLDGAVLANPDDDVWVARRASVGVNFECRDAKIYGSMMMQEMRVGANLDLRASTLTRPGRYTRDRNIKPCLDIRAAQVGRDVICSAGNQPFSSAGEVRMTRATIGRLLTFVGAELTCYGQTEGGRAVTDPAQISDADVSALNAFGVRTQELRLTMREPAKGRITLRQVQCAQLDDDENLWQATGGVDLDGFRYDTLALAIDLEDDERVRTRLRWMRAATKEIYRPGPYEQLASMLRANGNEEHADTVLIESQQHRYEALAKGFHVLGQPVLVWSWLQRWMVGYGYRPVRALAWLMMLLIVGSLWFWLFPLHCHPNVTDPPGYSGYVLCPLSNQDDHLVWNPFLFTLDLLIPIVDFGNKNRWSVPPDSMWLAATLTAAGWILATTVAAGLTRMLRKD